MTVTALRVGIIGCGLMGHTRVDALGADVLVAVADLDLESARALVDKHGEGEAVAHVDALLDRELDVVIVATPHDMLAELTCRALSAGAHVLVEKPAGVGSGDIDRIEQAALAAGRIVKVGFNHRFHPGIAHVIAAARSGRFGEVMFLRARYGHGGRLGYEQEWRLKPEISGGGEMVDQGIHLLDLSYAILGEVPLHSALLRNQFWTAPVEDNAAILLGEAGNRFGSWAQLHVTWTEWKNTFSLEIMCRTGKLQVDGLARSYGPQVVHVYTMTPEMGPPTVERIAFPAEDVSWKLEWDHLRAAIATSEPDPQLRGDLKSARYAWRQVEAAYAAAGTPNGVFTP